MSEKMMMIWLDLIWFDDDNDDDDDLQVNIAMTATYMIFGLSLFWMVFHLVQVTIIIILIIIIINSILYIIIKTSINKKSTKTAAF